VSEEDMKKGMEEMMKRGQQGCDTEAKEDVKAPKSDE
jgi:hypothetical protein